MYGKGLSPLNQVLNLIRTGQPGGMGGGGKDQPFYEMSFNSHVF